MSRVLGIHVAAKWTRVFNQNRVLAQLTLQKMSGQGVRTHPPMVLSAMALEIKLLAFSEIAILPSSLYEGPFI